MTASKNEDERKVLYKVCLKKKLQKNCTQREPGIKKRQNTELQYFDGIKKLFWEWVKRVKQGTSRGVNQI